MPSWRIVLALAAGVLPCAGLEWAVSTYAFSPAQLTLLPGADGVQVRLAGGVLPEGAPGAPWLPAVYSQIALPHGAQVHEVQIHADECCVQRALEVMPCQPQYPLSAGAAPRVPRDPAAYARRGRQPAALAEVAAVQHARRSSLAGITLHPVRYDAAARALYLATSITVRIGYERPVVQRRTLPVRTVMDALIEELAGPAADAQTQRAGAPPAKAATDYLVITSSALTGAFEQLAQYRRTADGFAAQVLAIENVTNRFSGADVPAAIRACIRQYVNDDGVSYVVLGGDDTVVPARKCAVSIRTYISTTMPTDLYYSGLDGTWDDWNTNGIYGEADVNGINDHDEGDLVPDVIVGRIPVRTAHQALAYINKLVAYETGVWSAATARRMLMGGVLFWDAYSGAQRPGDMLADGLPQFGAHTPVSDAEMWQRRLYRDGIQPHWQPLEWALFCDTLTSWDGGTAGDYPLSRANFSARWNNGWNYVSFGTHGSAASWSLETDSFGPGDALALTNAARVVYTVACDTAAFDSGIDPCLSEAFLRNANGGALAYIGCSRYGWGGPDEPPASPFSDGGTSSAYEYEFWHQVCAQRRARVGDAFALHKAAKVPACGANYAYRWVQFGLNLQGDPALRLRWDSGVYAAQGSVTNDSDGDAQWEPGESATFMLQVCNDTIGAVTATAQLEAVTEALAPLPPAWRLLTGLAGHSATALSYAVTAATNCMDGVHPLRALVSSPAGVRTTMLWCSVARMPAALIAPTAIVAAAESGMAQSFSIVISNSGSAALSFQIAGGDTYAWQHSDMTNGPPFAWRDISSSGTLVPLGDDDISAGYTPGHDVYFYGLRCTNIYIGSNGGVGLSPGYLDGNNQPLPCLPHNAPGACAAVFWDDLNPDPSQPGGAGEIRIATNAEETVIAWLGVPRLEYATQKQTFQLVLRHDGTLLYQYHTMQGGINEATVGVQADSLPARATQAAYNAAFVKNSFAVRFALPPLPAWLQCATARGMIMPGAAQHVQVDVVAGAHAADTLVYVLHNSGSTPAATPVTVTVIPEPRLWLAFVSIVFFCRLQSTLFVV